MKKLIYSIALIFASFKSQGQNTFPATGNAGIGTGATTEYPLEVKGSTVNIGITNTANTDAGIIFRNSAKTRSGSLNYNAGNGTFSLKANNRVLFSSSSEESFYDNMYFGGSGNPASMTIFAPNGGTGGMWGSLTFPALSINGTGSASSSRFSLGIIGTTPFIGPNSVGSSSPAAGSEPTLRHTSYTQINPLIEFYYLFDVKNNGTNIFNVNKDRSVFSNVVGIGTSNFSIGAKYKLYVAGGIRTESIKCDAPTLWPDYVFGEHYKLRSLGEVEEFISNNKHLPEIPAATELEKEGIDLAEMVKLQMMKIEELTLYIIEQEKRIKALEVAKR